MTFHGLRAPLAPTHPHWPLVGSGVTRPLCSCAIFQASGSARPPPPDPVGDRAPDTLKAQLCPAAEFPVWMWGVLHLAPSTLPLSSPAPASSLDLPAPTCSPLLAWPRVCMLGGGGGAGPCSVRKLGWGGALTPVVHRPGALGGFPWPPPTPREEEEALVSHRPGAGSRGVVGRESCHQGARPGPGRHQDPLSKCHT